MITVKCKSRPDFSAFFEVGKKYELELSGFLKFRVHDDFQRPYIINAKQVEAYFENY